MNLEIDADNVHRAPRSIQPRILESERRMEKNASVTSTPSSPLCTIPPPNPQPLYANTKTAATAPIASATGPASPAALFEIPIVGVLVPFVVVFEAMLPTTVGFAEVEALVLVPEAVAPVTVVALVTDPAAAVDTVALWVTGLETLLAAVVGRVETFAMVAVGVAVVTGTTVTTVVVVVAVVLAVDGRVVVEVEVVVEGVVSGSLLAVEMGLAPLADVEGVECVHGEEGVGGDDGVDGVDGEEGVECVEDGGELEDGIAVDCGAAEMTVLEEEALVGPLEMVKEAVSLVTPACTISKV